MNIKEYLLVCLNEEAVEIAHRISKSLRFGLYDVNPITELSNLQELKNEINDFFGVLVLLENNLKIKLLNKDKEKILAKQKKVLKYMEYSKSCGTLEKEERKIK